MRTPWHLWLIGIVSLIWNGGGAYDYLMTQLGIEPYLNMLNEAQLAFLEAVPAWFDAAWAIGVWGSVLGALLLLSRSRLASVAYGLSALGMVVAFLYSMFIASPSALEVNGPMGLAFSGVVFVLILLQMLYARAMTRRGVLS